MPKIPIFHSMKEERQQCQSVIGDKGVLQIEPLKVALFQ